MGNRARLLCLFLLFFSANALEITQIRLVTQTQKTLLTVLNNLDVIARDHSSFSGAQINIDALTDNDASADIEFCHAVNLNYNLSPLDGKTSCTLRTEVSIPFEVFTTGSPITSMGLTFIRAKPLCTVAKCPDGTVTFRYIYFIDQDLVCNITQQENFSGSSPKCKNGGTCTPQAVNSICTCPNANFIGSDCYDCKTDYFGKSCLKCTCKNGNCNEGINGNGKCSSCNTGFTGENCDQCLSGRYGSNCFLCACVNGTCNQGISGDGKCTCFTGFTGQNCTQCLPGRFGPSCLPCTCVNGTCNQGTSGNGKCSSCTTGFTGENCDQCSPGRFGPSCLPCTCVNGTCNQGTSGNGKCSSCTLGFTGENCNQCLSGRFGPSCLPCTCVNGTCNQGTSGNGKCSSCTIGFTGENCDQCSPGRYGPSCLPCTCINGTCNQGTSGNGKCSSCTIGFVGENCNECLPGRYGPNCLPCFCVNGACNEGIAGTGKCTCQLGWAGDTCDICGEGFTGPGCATCTIGFYGTNCTACNCLNGKCLDGKLGSGKCNCNPGWSGTSCDTCAPGFTGTSCNQCLTGYFGSSCSQCTCVNGECNQGINGNGKCTCQSGWAGSSCNVCASGFASPNCTSCLSNFYGPSCQACPTCPSNSLCNGNDGSCQCLGNFTPTGKCDQCLPSFYGKSCESCPNCGKGKCQDGINGSGECLCDPGWSFSSGSCSICSPNRFGPNCEQCPSCGTYGSCNSTLNGDGKCTCQAGFKGDLCDSCVAGTFPNCYEPVACPSECNAKYSFCDDKDGSCKCSYISDVYPSCTEGMECAKDCGTYGKCDRNTGKCVCENKYEGETCNTCAKGYESYPECYQIISCPNNCNNNGKCDGKSGLCNCETQFSGNDCGSCSTGYSNYQEGCWEIIQCADASCSGKGKCNLKSGECECIPEYTGQICENVNNCFNSPCLNGGKCQNTVSSYTCSCAAGFTGSNCRYRLIKPVIGTISPKVVPLTGGNITVTGTDIETPLTVTFKSNNQQIGKVIVNELRNVKKRDSQFVITTPSMSAEGPVAITFTNPGGLSQDFTDFFFSPNCPFENQYGVGSDCKACPTGATCPGGNRIIPNPGYWNPDINTPPTQCTSPSTRCPGGQPNLCATGYTGDVCSKCSSGFQPTSDGSCIACDGPCADNSSSKNNTGTIIAIVVVVILLIILIGVFAAYYIYKKNQNKKTDVIEENNLEQYPVSRPQHSTAKLVASQSEPESLEPVDVIPEPRLYPENPKSGPQPIFTSPPSVTPTDPKPASSVSKMADFFAPQERISKSELEGSVLQKAEDTIRSNPNLMETVLYSGHPLICLPRACHQIYLAVAKQSDNFLINDIFGNPSAYVDGIKVSKLINEIAQGIVVEVAKTVSKVPPHISQRLKVYFHEDQGPRPQMEDKFCIQPFANELVGQPNLVDIFGVFDGHGGPITAKYIATHLHVNLMKDEDFHSDIEESIRESYLSTNEKYFAFSQRESHTDNVGSTCVLCVIRDNTLWVSYAGDSEAALYRKNGEKIKCCTPHKPWMEREKQRIEAKGGYVQERGGLARVCGALAVARAFGDGRYRQFIDCEPDIMKIELQGNEEYLVIACDGLWDVMTVETVGEFLNGYASNPDKHQMVTDLVQKARSLGSTDNITVVIVNFNS